uniref:Uncharacterized protein n=1 Tax=Leptocylindrus danicus TaxID=163516 RepID=A0A7S2PAP7_9STRA
MTILYLQHSNDPSTSTTTVAQKRRLEQALQYDYAFDVDDHSHIDAVSISIGANHSMLQGGTMITTVLESIYAHGATSAREGAILDVIGRKRKRDILRHLPVVDFTVGVRNAYIPKQSCSFSDDGLTRYLPEVKGGRMMVRIIGDGTSDYSSMNSVSNESGDYSTTRQLLDGIKLIADVGVSSFVVHAESQIHEFPELDIFEGVQLRSFLSGSVGCRIQAHLRPDITHQTTATVVATTTNSHYNNNPNNRNCRDRGSPITITGPNVLNPLEAYEIDFTGSTCTLKIKESNIALGHRRIIIPSETGLYLKVLESVVDMSMDKGNTLCEFSWDFQGSSPILQVTNVGHSPASAAHENKRQVSLLIPQMRQGRMNFHVSSVGGIRFHQAATIRENKEGLYDWKFFNALVSVDGDDGETAASRLMDVIHDKRTMHKLLQIAKLVSADLGRILEYALTQIWRAKEILDQEGINEPGHAIPCHKTARLLSLFLCGDLSQINVIVPILQRVTSGGGLDVVKTKELLQQHLQLYEDWAPEMDRLVRLVAVMVGPMVAPAPYEENGEDALPLCELEEHAARFRGILTAKEMYEVLHDPSLASSATMNQVALDIAFSNYIALVAPYLSIRQVEYVLQARSSRDWQPEDLRRLRYVYSVKKKVLDISESYGGLSFLPQSFFCVHFCGGSYEGEFAEDGGCLPFFCNGDWSAQ